MILDTTKWKYNKTWVYSITYDEALSELHRFVIPHHEHFGIPGHLEAVVGHMGVERQIGASSYNGFHHMSPAEMREMIAAGWGVGNHSWSHFNVADDPELELLKAREVLEDAIGRAVTVYCAPGSNANLTPFIIDKAKEYGYLAGMGIYDRLNFPDSEDLFFLNRPPLHETFSDLFESIFDPFRRIQQAKKNNGWIIDYLHCPLETAVHDYKDCSAAHHYERLETVTTEGKYDCWFANPDDVVDYRYMRRYAKLQETDANTFKINLEGLPKQVMNRELTFTVQSPHPVTVTLNGNAVSTWQLENGVWAFNAKVEDGDVVRGFY
ncbi:MAG: polysaccharide deacetylase family protein [Oscillospiraceae bacterium]|nr:polysaccharide deacetylase family protein [Oscillospiraceae bacterium]